MKLTVREATRADHPQMIALIETCGLYSDSVQMGAGIQYWICLADGEPLGVVGMEHNGSAALLRSMAVHPKARKAGVASLLLQQVAKFTLKHGISTLYIFTIGPSTWAERWQFEQFSPLEVAAVLPSSPQVRGGFQDGWIYSDEVFAWRNSAQRLFQLSQNRL